MAGLARVPTWTVSILVHLPYLTCSLLAGGSLIPIRNRSKDSGRRVAGFYRGFIPVRNIS